MSDFRNDTPGDPPASCRTKSRARVLADRAALALLILVVFCGVVAGLMAAIVYPICAYLERINSFCNLIADLMMVCVTICNWVAEAEYLFFTGQFVPLMTMLLKLIAS